MPEGRLRLAAHRCTRTPAGVCRIEVELEASDGRLCQGRAEGATGATGELRLAAEATLQALDRALAGAIRFELLGVKSLRAFDANLVIVAVATERLGRPTRLLGCVQASGELEHAAVLAVLDATNRICALGVTR
jgi:hypothetical protein